MTGYRVDAAIATGPGYAIVENASLEGRNTLRVPARAQLLIEVRNAEALPELFALPALHTLPLAVLGEGSNVLFTGDWPGIVLTIGVRGIAPIEEDAGWAIVRVGAGENWNDFVSWSLAHGFVGLENLVLIPGSVGAAPIQNIGAYGVEVGEFIVAVHAWDRTTGQHVTLDHAACAFAYRDSLFKREVDRLLVTAVDFRLPRQRALRLDYAGIGAELATLGAHEPTAQRVAEAVARLRMRKLPNPALIGNAGSFFKNPVVDTAVAQAIRGAHPDLPSWPVEGGGQKLPAAWLIEACGLKGYRDGDAGMSDQHALVLVNHGRASGADLLRVARHVATTVFKRFDVRLQAEPRILGSR